MSVPVPSSVSTPWLHDGRHGDAGHRVTAQGVLNGAQPGVEQPWATLSVTVDTM